MSVTQYQNTVNSLDKEIADLEKKKAVKDKEIATLQDKINSVKKSITKNTSPASLSSKQKKRVTVRTSERKLQIRGKKDLKPI